MNQRWSNLVGRIIVGAVAAVVVAGCGGGDSTSSDGGDGGASSAKGKSLFVEKCGSCHTLDAAGTTGQVGPSLDDVMPEEQRVLDQVENGGGAMPPQLVKGAEARAVAAYVASAAGH